LADDRCQETLALTTTRILTGLFCYYRQDSRLRQVHRISRPYFCPTAALFYLTAAFAAAHRAGLDTSAFVMFGLPSETRAEMLETVQLLADIKPTRYRWAIFFPFVGTEAYQIAADAGVIDMEKMQHLTNFMDASCLDFGAETNLFIKKLQKTYPWWVNAATDWPCAERYRDKITEIDAMTETEFDAIAETCREQDERLSHELNENNMVHYAIKYNAFMAVRQP